VVNIRSTRAGAVLPLIAVFITAFMLVAALTINSNWFMFNITNAQNTADIAARATLQSILADTNASGRFDRARDLGARLYDLNLARKDAPGFTRDRIRFGTVIDSLADDPTFTETFNENETVSAVHVDSPIQLEQQQVEVFFANLLGSAPHVRIFADAKVSNRPIDIMLCLDASRSMNRVSGSRDFPPNATTVDEQPMPGSRWFELTATVESFLVAMRNTNPNARVGLVTFGGGATFRRQPNSELDEDLARFEKDLTLVIADDITDIPDIMQSYADDFPALGLGTSIYDGINLSLSSFLNDTDSAKHIVMLSDGRQLAVPSPAPIGAAEDAADANVTIHTISFSGTTAGERELQDIAKETKGTFFPAANEDQLRDAFEKLLGRFQVQLID